LQGSQQGRWLSPDPAEAGWNAYAYATNPNSFVDPSGLNRAFPGQCQEGNGMCPEEGAGADPTSIDNSGAGTCDAAGNCGGWNNLTFEQQANVLTGIWSLQSQASSGDGSIFGDVPGVNQFTTGTIVRGDGTFDSPYLMIVSVFDIFDPEGNLQLIPDSGGAANNWSLFGWDANAWKTFFKTAINPLPELQKGGCGNVFLTAGSNGGIVSAVSDNLDGGPGTGPDDVIKQAGAIAAAQYVVNQGLAVPLRSSIYRGILSGTETAASSFILGDTYYRIGQGFYAEYSAFKAGACQ
jgi:hypothetical protein